MQRCGFKSSCKQCFFFQFSKQFTSLRSQYLINTIQFRNQYYYQEGFVYNPYYGAPLVEYLEIGVSYLLATRKTPCWQESQNIGKALVKINCQQPNRHLVSRCIGTIQATITTCSGDMTTTDIKYTQKNLSSTWNHYVSAQDHM